MNSDGYKFMKDSKNIKSSGQPSEQPPSVVPINVETPNVETPNVETPNVETPNVETPNVETPNVETPNVETPNVEPFSTWAGAIMQVLKENDNEQMHVDEIANAIVDKKYYVPKKGSSSYRARIEGTCSIKKDLFQRVSPACYVIISDVYERLLRQGQVEESLEELDESAVVEETRHILEKILIKSYGMYWMRDNVDWNSRSLCLWGKESNSSSSVCVNFADQVGIYLLYDRREIIYIGQVTEDRLGKRLFEHTKDHLASRWDRFSWFGLKDIDTSNRLIDLSESFENILIKNLINAFESLLIEVIEPRKNKKKAPDTGKEYVQACNEDITRFYSQWGAGGVGS